MSGHPANGDPIRDEEAAFALLRKQINLEFAVRLVAIEIAVAAILIRSWPQNPMQVAAAVAGSTLIGLSVHRARMRNLWRSIRKTAQHSLAALSAITDLAQEKEERRLPVDHLTLLVVIASLGIAAWCFLA